MSDITIYHNPKCGTSRNTLAMIRQSGVEPNIVLYLETPPNQETLQGLIQSLNLPVREVMRRKGTPYEELGLDDPKWSEAQLIEHMLATPILINRPIVVSPLARACADPLSWYLTSCPTLRSETSPRKMVKWSRVVKPCAAVPLPFELPPHSKCLLPR